MRLRNIPRADQVLSEHSKVIKDELQKKGKWKEVFGNDNPLYVEIGMGKGQFLTTLAEKNPDKNYIGIERYSSVLLRAVERLDTMKEREDLAMENIRFICMDAADVQEVFGEEEIAGIYLNFSDPWPKKRHARRRLTSKEFLKRYEKILAKEGVVEFKTDNQELFHFSLEQVNEAGWELKGSTWDLHHDEKMFKGNVMTEYEEKFSSRGNPICKLIAASPVKDTNFLHSI